MQPVLRPTMPFRAYIAPGSHRPFARNCAAQFAAKPSSSPWGINANRLSHTDPNDPITPATYTQINTLLGEANIGWIRIDFDARNYAMQAPFDTATFDWTAMDEAVNNALCSGMSILGNISYTSGVSTPRPGVVDSAWTYFPANFHEWPLLVRAAVDRYHDIRYWSVWNEPNSTDYFKGSGGSQDPVTLSQEYGILVDSAAPHIRSNVDQYGRRYLVGPEIALGDDAADQWLGRVLAAHGPNIDVVAVHQYGDTAAVRMRVAGLPQRVGGGYWPWQTWLTETGPTGCNYYRSDRSPDRCTGPYNDYIRDDVQAAYINSVAAAMLGSGGSAWAKTFFWHSHEQVVSHNDGEAYGILDGARQNSLVGRPAFTTYAGIAGPLQVNGATFSAGGAVPLTAVPGVASAGQPYYFVWEYRWCSQGGGPDDCTYEWYAYDEGSDLRTVDAYIAPGDYNVQFRVHQYTPDQRTTFGTAWHVVTGPASCQDGSCTRIPGAGTPYSSRAGTLGVRASRASASSATAVTAGTARPDSTGPVTGRPATSGDSTSLNYWRTYGAAGVRRWLSSHRPIHPGAEVLP